MKHRLTFLLFLCFVSSLSATDSIEVRKVDKILADTSSYTLANLEGMPSMLVHGCVNVLTGDYLDSQTDLVLARIRALSFRKALLQFRQTRGFFRAWMESQSLGRSDRTKFKETSTCRDKGGAGGEYVYSGYQSPTKGYKYDDLTLDPQLLKKGITNCALGILSGRTNIKNHSLVLTKSLSLCKMFTGSGTKHDYTYCLTDDESKSFFVLDQTIKPNGQKCKYFYHRECLDAMSETSIRNNVGTETNL